MTKSSSSAVPRPAVVADIAAALFASAGLAWIVFGPMPEITLMGVRLTMSSPRRAFLLAALVLAIRHWRVPRHPRLERLFARWCDRSNMGEAALADARSWPARLVELVVVTATFTALVAAATWPQVIQLDAVPDFGDPLFSTWRIAWIAHQLPRDPVHLFDGNIFHPERLTLTYSDPVLVPALMSAPFLWLGRHPITVYNLLFLSGFVLSGVAAYYLARALTGRRDSATISGVIFALYPYRFEHYSHLELQMTMWMPLTLIALHRAFADGSTRNGVAFGVAIALQMLSSLYYGLFLAVCSIPIGVALWLGRRRPVPPVRACVLGFLFAGILVAPIAARYLENKPMLGERPLEEVHTYSARPTDYLEPHFRSRLYGHWSDGGQAERQLFPGVMPVALAAMALRPGVSVACAGYGLMLLVALDGSFGLNGTTFALFREYFPPFRNLRVAARFSILVGLSLAILAGYGSARLLRRWPRWRLGITAGLLALICIDLAPRLTLEPVWRQPPPVYDVLSPETPAVLAEFPVPASVGDFYLDARYLYFSTFHWQRLVNGYSGFFPPSYIEFVDQGRKFPRPETIEYLKSRHVDYFAVHEAFYDGRAQFAEDVASLDRREDIELVTRSDWQGGESRLYRFRH